MDHPIAPSSAFAKSISNTNRSKKQGLAFVELVSTTPQPRQVLPSPSSESTSSTSSSAFGGTRPLLLQKEIVVVSPDGGDDHRAAESNGHQHDNSNHHQSNNNENGIIIMSSSSQPPPPPDIPPSNERLLGTAFISFMSFALLQLFFAFLAQSEAMMGDSAAMIVDALTYLFNYIAERRKTQFITANAAAAQQRQLFSQAYLTRLERAKRKMLLELELIPPLVSVTALIVVTILVLKKALHVLYLDVEQHRDISLQSNPSLNLMLAFSVLNLLLDLLNVACFARAKHLLGFQTTTQHDEQHQSNHDDDEESYYCKTTHQKKHNNRNNKQRKSYSQISATEDDDEEHGGGGDNNMANGDGLVDHSSGSNGGCEFEDEHEEQLTVEEEEEQVKEEDEEDDSPNLNMCSAYTHVFADTLRSIAVIVAALIAKLAGPSVTTPEEADATAAVVVTALILASLIPLASGMAQSAREWQTIRREEQNEESLLQETLRNTQRGAAAAASRPQQAQQIIELPTTTANGGHGVLT